MDGWVNSDGYGFPSPDGRLVWATVGQAEAWPSGVLALRHDGRDEALAGAGEAGEDDAQGAGHLSRYGHQLIVAQNLERCGCKSPHLARSPSPLSTHPATTPRHDAD